MAKPVKKWRRDKREAVIEGSVVLKPLTDAHLCAHCKLKPGCADWAKAANAMKRGHKAFEAELGKAELEIDIGAIIKWMVVDCKQYIARPVRRRGRST